MRKVAVVALVLLAACAAQAEALTLQHGHLVPIESYVDSNTGRTVTSDTHAFLAIRLPFVPDAVDFIDYGQKISGNVTYASSELTSAATIDRWIILPVRRPCSPDQTGWVSVGRIAVCHPRNWTAAQNGWYPSVFYSCAPENEFEWTYSEPVWVGVPPERVLCGDDPEPGDPYDPDPIDKEQ